MPGTRRGTARVGTVSGIVFKHGRVKVCFNHRMHKVGLGRPRGRRSRQGLSMGQL
jgi:hypothetical protein